MNDTIRANSNLIRQRDEANARNFTYRKQLHDQGRSINRLRRRAKGYRERIEQYEEVLALNAQVIVDQQDEISKLRGERDALTVQVSHFKLLAAAEKPAENNNGNGWTPGKMKMPRGVEKTVAKRLLKGEKVEDIAAEYGVSTHTVYQRTATHRRVLKRQMAEVL